MRAVARAAMATTVTAAGKVGGAMGVGLEVEAMAVVAMDRRAVKAANLGVVKAEAATAGEELVAAFRAVELKAVGLQEALEAMAVLAEAETVGYQAEELVEVLRGTATEGIVVESQVVGAELLVVAAIQEVAGMDSVEGEEQTAEVAMAACTETAARAAAVVIWVVQGASADLAEA